MASKYREEKTAADLYSIIPALDRVQGKHSATRLLDADDVRHALSLWQDFSRYGRVWVTMDGGAQPHWSQYKLPATALTISPEGRALVQRRDARSGLAHEQGKRITIQIEPAEGALLPLKYRGFLRTVHEGHGEQFPALAVYHAA